MRGYSTILRLIMITVFSAAIVLPELNSRVHLIAEEAGNENRAKTKKPEFNVNKLDQYVKDFDSYYTDNFNLRETLIRIYNNFEFYFWKKSPVPDDVVVGKENWFYDMDNLPDYKGTNLFTPVQLSTLQQELALRTQWAEDMGVKYYVAVVPNKMHVYPEYLPKNVIKLSGVSRYDQLISLDNKQGIRIIDLKENIVKHKDQEQYLYQHTDGHWNELGSYFGYQAIMNRLAKDFPELSPRPVSDYSITIDEREGQLAKMMNVEKNYPEQFVKLIPKNEMLSKDGQKRGYPVPHGIGDWDYEIVKVNEHGKKLKCLIIRDSFTFQMLQYFQEHFQRTVFIHGQWRAAMFEEFILREKPDIVINILVETFLHNLIQFPFVPPAERENLICLKAANGMYIDVSEGDTLKANREKPRVLDAFSMIQVNDSQYAFSTASGQYLSAELAHMNEIIANRDKIAGWEIFTMVRLSDNQAAFKAANGKYLSLNEKTLMILASGSTISRNETFEMINVKSK